MKVYCENCKYFEIEWMNEFGHNFRCKHPSNVEILSSGVYKKYETEYKEIPESINIHNDCKNYKRLWHKFWIKEK